jgi:hypothetical protein
MGAMAGGWRRAACQLGLRRLQREPSLQFRSHAAERRPDS